MTVFSIVILAAIGLMLMIAAERVVAKALGGTATLCRLPSNKWVNYTITGIAAVSAPVLAFVLLACGTAVVVPPPQAFTYASIDVNPEATFFQRNAAYIAIETGLADVKVHPGVVYSTATWKKSKDETKTYIGLPGAGKWYSL
jgi:hypothetical protein